MDILICDPETGKSHQNSVNVVYAGRPRCFYLAPYSALQGGPEGTVSCEFNGSRLCTFKIPRDRIRTLEVSSTFQPEITGSPLDVNHHDVLCLCFERKRGKAEVVVATTLREYNRVQRACADLELLRHRAVEDDQNREELIYSCAPGMPASGCI